MELQGLVLWICMIIVLVSAVGINETRGLPKLEAFIPPPVNLPLDIGACMIARGVENATVDFAIMDRPSSPPIAVVMEIEDISMTTQRTVRSSTRTARKSSGQPATTRVSTRLAVAARNIATKRKAHPRHSGRKRRHTRRGDASDEDEEYAEDISEDDDEDDAGYDDDDDDDSDDSDDSGYILMTPLSAPQTGEDLPWRRLGTAHKSMGGFRHRKHRPKVSRTKQTAHKRTGEGIVRQMTTRSARRHAEATTLERIIRDSAVPNRQGLRNAVAAMEMPAPATDIRARNRMRQLPVARKSAPPADMQRDANIYRTKQTARKSSLVSLADTTSRLATKAARKLIPNSGLIQATWNSASSSTTRTGTRRQGNSSNHRDSHGSRRKRHRKS